MSTFLNEESHPRWFCAILIEVIGHCTERRFTVPIICFSSLFMSFIDVAFEALCLKKCIGIYPESLLLSQDTFEC